MPNVGDWTPQQLSKFIQTVTPKPPVTPPTASAGTGVKDLVTLLTAPWTSHFSGSCNYYKDDVGNVHIEGSISKAGNAYIPAEVIFTLPPGFRPNADLGFLMPMSTAAANGAVFCTITGAGAFTYIRDVVGANNKDYIYLGAITYKGY